MTGKKNVMTEDLEDELEFDFEEDLLVELAEVPVEEQLMESRRKVNELEAKVKSLDHANARLVYDKNTLDAELKESKMSKIRIIAYITQEYLRSESHINQSKMTSPHVETISFHEGYQMALKDVSKKMNLKIPF